MEKKNIAVLVLAAGKGTRMNSELPKVLHKVCGLTLVERVLKAAAALRPSSIVTVIGHGAELLEQEIARLRSLPEFQGITLETAIQAEQLGTGHAAQVGLEKVDSRVEKVLIVPGDVPLLSTDVLQDLLTQAQQEQADLAVLTCLHPQPASFGRVIRGVNGDILKITELKDCSESERNIPEINTSIYLGATGFLRESLKLLKPNNAQQEYYLTDVVADAVNRKLKVVAEATSDVQAVTGVNDRYELSLIEAEQRKKINRQLMLAGVTMEDPENTYIDEQVTIGPDTFIGAGCRIKGNTTIAENVFIEGLTTIENARIEAGAMIKLSCYIADSVVGASCQLGPFAHLRPGTLLHEKVKVGNFVETKKAELHAGAKANHLTYLGDAEVGAHTNIGAGTITCNYDGVHKFRTTIGEKCFIGSNTALVAPISVGTNAYVGAGSTITKDVPGRALAVARGAQRNIENWVDRKQRNKEG